MKLRKEKEAPTPQIFAQLNASGGALRGQADISTNPDIQAIIVNDYLYIRNPFNGTVFTEIPEGNILRIEDKSSTNIIHP